MYFDEIFFLINPAIPNSEFLLQKIALKSLIMVTGISFTCNTMGFLDAPGHPSVP